MEAEAKKPQTPEICSSSKPEETAVGGVAEAEDPAMYRTAKPGIKRLILTLSIVFSFLLGSPFLLKSVEIYRSPLPFSDIDSLSKQVDAAPVLFPCHFQAVFLGFDTAGASAAHLILEKLGLAIRGEMGRYSPICSDNFTLSVTLDAGSSEGDCARSQNKGGVPCLWRCGAVGAAAFDYNDGDDEGVDELLGSVLGDPSGGKVYSVVAVNKGGEEEGMGMRTVVGTHRHAWILGRGSEAEDMVSRVAETFVKVFVHGGVVDAIPGEFMPVGADGRTVLSFNLLNADPNDWIYDWDFQRVDEILLSPLAEALGVVTDLSIESQVLYHTPKASFSYWDEERSSYIFNTKDLPFFVNSNEWHLDTSIGAGGRSKILQFVVYVPSAKECPLLLELPNGEISATNGFISPMWGGVIVWNPPGCLKISGSKHSSKHRISDQELEQLFEVFVGQLRQLFGLSNNICDVLSGSLKVLASERGFTEWELDVLSRHHTCYNLVSCSTTLGSLSRLVQSLPRMIIMNEIGKQVNFSLTAAKLAQTSVSLGVYDTSAVSSREARSLAEDAFSHPSIMSVSYYSFEHCFAVYSPFFLPVLLHVLLAAIREWKRFKVEKAKFAAWKMKVNTETQL